MAARWKTASTPSSIGPQLGVAEVGGVEREVGVSAGLGEVGFLDGAGVMRDEGVDPGDGVAELEEAFAEVGADESGGAGDETFHIRASVGLGRTRPAM